MLPHRPDRGAGDHRAAVGDYNPLASSASYANAGSNRHHGPCQPCYGDAASGCHFDSANPHCDAWRAG